jgi:hypothetical protein
MVNYDWLNELWLKRRAQFSTVAFIKSSDPKRLPQLLKFLNSIYSSSRERKPFKIYLYKVWSGLYEVFVRDNIVYNPVVATTQSPFPISQQLQLRDLSSALEYIDNALLNNERIIVIFYGLFSYKTISDNEHYNFVKFLRNAIFSSEYYIKYHFIIIFTSDPHSIVDEDTLKHSIVVDVPPSTFEERVTILKDIAKQLGIDVDEKDIQIIAESMRGLNLHEVESVALESIFKYSTYKLDAMISFKHELIKKSGLLDIEKPTFGLKLLEVIMS